MLLLSSLHLSGVEQARVQQMSVTNFNTPGVRSTWNVLTGVIIFVSNPCALVSMTTHLPICYDHQNVVLGKRQSHISKVTYTTHTLFLLY